MRKFEIGKNYNCKSACDSNCTWEYKVISRTEKTVTLNNGKRFKISNYQDQEMVYPLGRYSLAPILRAE